MGIELAPDLEHVHFHGVAPAPRLRAPPPSRSADPHVDPFVTWLFSCFDLDANAYDARSLHRRLPACLRALGVDSPAAARASIEGDPARRARALQAMLVGVSGFFRDTAAFQALEAQVLPRLAPGKSGLRVCALGASEGQELYSVAMLLADLGRLGESELLGMDVRPDAITFASRGVYAPEQLDGVPSGHLRRHFTPVHGGAQVRSLLRSRTVWRTGSVFSRKDAEGQWDLVLFRNVGIYLTPGAAVNAWEMIAKRLAPSGVVFTGTAERPPPSTRLRPIARCCYAGAAA